MYLYILPLEKTCIYTLLLVICEFALFLMERGVGTLASPPLAHEGQKDHQTNDLPHGLDRASKSEQFRHRGIP